MDDFLKDKLKYLPLVTIFLLLFTLTISYATSVGLNYTDFLPLISEIYLKTPVLEFFSFFFILIFDCILTCLFLFIFTSFKLVKDFNKFFKILSTAIVTYYLGGLIVIVFKAVSL